MGFPRIDGNCSENSADSSGRVVDSIVCAGGDYARGCGRVRSPSPAAGGISCSVGAG